MKVAYIRQPFTANMTMDDAVKRGLEQSGYAILASAYLQEAFNRAALSVRELAQRANQMMTCGKDIDTQRPLNSWLLTVTAKY